MQYPPTIICPVCGLRNDITVRFCRNCGLPLGAPRDPVRGTTTKRAELPSDRGTGIAAIFGLLVVVGIVGVAGFFIYKGFQANAGVGTATATAKPRPSQGSGPSAAPAATALVSFPAASTGPGASAEPGASQPVVSDPPAETGAPAVTDAPTDTDAPTAEPDPTPVAVTTVSAWTCKTGAIADPLNGKWRVIRASWNSGASTDRVTLTLTRVNGTVRNGTTVNLAYMSPARAASKYGVTRPVGDRAIVLTFDGPISVGTPKVGIPGLRAIASVDVRHDASGVTHAVIGVTGTGCARLNAADWRNGSDATQTAALTLDVRR
jgi:hypothetical protein